MTKTQSALPFLGLASLVGMLTVLIVNSIMMEIIVEAQETFKEHLS